MSFSPKKVSKELSGHKSIVELLEVQLFNENLHLKENESLVKTGMASHKASLYQSNF